jgi:teichuronic acid biosynthesis glycosyltransferase TuaG
MDNLISIITTVKNGEEHLLETLESVKAQTFKNFEHIVVDDGSTDKTVLLIKRFKEANSDYPLFIYEPGNLGRGKALNFAVSKAKGEWIAIIDADDIWHPQKLEIQWKCVLSNEIDVLGTSGGLFSKTEELEFHNINEVGNIQCFSINDLLKSNRLSHSSVLIKKEICEYDEKRKSQFDYELWLRLASVKLKLAKVNNTLNFHRIHENQSFEGKFGKQYRWLSFKLKNNYAFRQRKFLPIFYNTFKLFFDIFLPRKVRLKIRMTIIKQ